MSKPEQIPLQKHMGQEELQKRIKTLENDVKILKRLYFIKYRYNGLTAEQASLSAFPSQLDTFGRAGGTKKATTV